MSVLYHDEFYHALLAAAGIAKAQCHTAADLQRCEAGTYLAWDGKVVIHHDHSATVESATENGILYAVYCKTCTCVDFQQHPARRCKHIWAARLHAQAWKGSLPLDGHAGMYSEAVRDAQALAGSRVARVCSPEFGDQRGGGCHATSAGR